MLDDALDVLDARLAAAFGGPAAPRTRPPPAAAGRAIDAAPLQHLAERFGLTPLDRELVVLAIAAELDGGYAARFASLESCGRAPRPTATLAAALLGTAPHEVLRRLAGRAPLPSSGLVTLAGDGPLALRPLVPAPELAMRMLDPRWPGRFAVTLPRADALDRLVLAPGLRARIEALGARLHHTIGGHPPVVCVYGRPGRGRHAIARAIAMAAGHAALSLTAAETSAAIDTRALAREASWFDAAVVLEAGAPPDLVRELAAHLRCPLLVVSDAPPALDPAHFERGWLELEVPPFGAAERAVLWQRLVPPATRGPDVDLDSLAARFRLGPAHVAMAARLADEQAGTRAVATADLDAACRRVPAVAFGSLAEVLPCPYLPEDLVLAPAARREVELAIAWARRGRGGPICLFHGPPGTGKTMAAQIVARSVGFDLVRIDLSRVVSKYIGETEKQLGAVFAAAEEGNVVLFFDEADALFGKRTEVRDAHDRYANIETGYLLQRIESFPGVVVLATNLRSNLDPAFQRRVQVCAELAAPGPEHRRLIWDRLLTGERAADVDLDLMAQRFALTGGDIRNATQAAAVLAADDNEPIGMRHLLIGAWRELRKAGRLLNADELGPWAPVIAALGGDAGEPTYRRNPGAR